MKNYDNMYENYVKGFIDFIIALLILFVLFPLLLILTLALYFANRGNPFFFQPRPGKDEKVFNIVKFKTMNDKKDLHGNLLPDVLRITKVGGFVRKTSLDEIPQLINVIKGDMSLVGPRPLRTYYLPLYSETQKKRHNVKPGITGWAQVNGRNAISWSKKFEYDVYYVENLCFSLDFKIMVRTFLKVLTARDVNSSKEITMEKFNGTN